MSKFQGLSTALAASMGTGNIIGVAAAISVGGPGAVFWMWVSALLGTAVGFAENVLGTRYGGPMGYIAKAAGSDRAAGAYAIACAAAAFGIGNMTQTNALSSAMSEFGISPYLSGAVIAVLCGAIICGGRKNTARAAEKLLPAAALLYLLGALFVMVKFAGKIPEMLLTIVKSAIGYSQIAGGICGAALRKTVSTGLRRGVFSNEAGMGSSVLIHSEMDHSGPAQAGMMAVTEIVIDTLICCTATAFVILLTGAGSSEAEGLAMVTAGFSPVLGKAAPFFTSAVTALFAFCTLLGWYYYAERCVRYLFPESSVPVYVYRVLYIIAAFLGAVAELTIVWELADMLNWSMLVINLTAVVLLRREVPDYTNSIISARHR